MGHTRSYLDIFIQLQSVKTDIFAQVIFLDEALYGEASDLENEVKPLAFIPEKETFYVQLAGFGQILKKWQSLETALYHLLFVGSEEIVYGEVQEVGNEIGKWLIWAMEVAHQRDKSLRIRLQMNQTAKRQQSSWHQLRETGILRSPTIKLQEDRAEAELDETIDWTLYLPWEAVLSELWQKQAQLQIGNEVNWSTWAKQPQAVSLVRTLPLVRPYNRGISSSCTEKRSPKGSLSVFLAWSSPTELAETHSASSIPQIRESLENTDGFSVAEPLNCATVDQLRVRLAEQEWDIVHILAHGETDEIAYGDVNGLSFKIADVGLIVETGDQSAQRVASYQLSEMITNNGHPPPQLVFLQACDSAAVYGDLFRGIAQSLIAAGVQYVVAMQTPIRVDVAERFAIKFYEGLATWQSVDQAMSVARAELETINERANISNNPILKELFSSAHLPAWSIPVLFMRDEADGWLKQGPLPEAIYWIDGKIMLLIKPTNGDSPFFIDKYPVTVGQYKRYKQNWQSPFDDEPWANGVNVDNIPATNIDRNGICSYASYYEKQLPTQMQWESALTDGGRTNYAFGNKFEPNQYNCRQYWGGSNQMPRPTEVTEFERDENSERVQDMLGNCLEIVLDKEGNYCVIGGSFRSSFEKSESMTMPSLFPGRKNIIGFRCVVDLKTFRYFLTEKIEKAEDFIACRSDKDK